MKDKQNTLNENNALTQQSDVIQVESGSQALSKKKIAKQELNENEKQKEVGGPKGPEPTRYGDWEAKGRCFDF